MACEIIAELTPERFAEAGEPVRLFRDIERGFVALLSVMSGTGNQGRSLFPDTLPPPYRLSIYREADAQLVGVVATKFPVNDVAFHPDEDNLLLATGAYDGGWMFMGYLLRYNWRTGMTEQILGPCREVVACRYDTDGTIALLLRPQNEEEFEEDAWSTVLGIRIASAPGRWQGQPVEMARKDERTEGLRPCAPSEFGFPADVAMVSRERWQAYKEEAMTWVRTVHSSTHYRTIRDLMWLGRERFAVAGDGFALEIRDTRNGVNRHFGSDGNSVELIHHPLLGILSHVQIAGRHAIEGRTELWQWQKRKLSLVWKSDRLSFLGFDGSGYGLAADQSWGNNQDRRNVVLSPEGKFVRTTECERCDRVGLNMFAKGLGTIYFLKREGQEPYHNRDFGLWRHVGHGQFAYVRQWDFPERDFHPVTGVAYAEDLYLGAGVVHDRARHEFKVKALELVEMRTGRREFSIPLQCSPTCVALTENRQTAAVGMIEGSLTFFDLKSQSILGQIRLEKHGIPSVPLALEIQGSKILIGTQDGRILLGELHGGGAGGHAK